MYPSNVRTALGCTIDGEKRTNTLLSLLACFLMHGVIAMAQTGPGIGFGFATNSIYVNEAQTNVFVRVMIWGNRR